MRPRVTVVAVTLLWRLVVLGAAEAQGGDPAPEGATLRGRVVDARTGEPLANALARVREVRRETASDHEGRFELRGLPAGTVQLYVSTVGYGFLEKTLTLQAGQDLAVDVALSPEAVRHAEDVVVTGGVFDPVEATAPAEYNLNPGELKNLASVLADDPLRSVQTLPGVATGDDFSATFAARGAGFLHAGFYVDDVPATAPFHTIRNIDSGGGSITILSGDLVESLSFMSGGAPVRYGDRIGPVLSMRTRDGGERFSGRANLSLAGGLSATLEGPWAGTRGNWIAGARKSYLDYVVRRVSEDSNVVGYFDLQGKVTFRASPSHRLSLFALHGDFDWEERVLVEGLDDHTRAEARTSLAKLQWRWLPSPSGSLEASVFAAREGGRNLNPRGDVLIDQDSWHGGFRADLTQAIGDSHRLEAGLLGRRLGEERTDRASTAGRLPVVVSLQYDRRTSQPGAYLQDTWTRGRIALSAGLRADRLGVTEETAWLPRGSLTVRLREGTTLAATAGAYAQFPRPVDLWGPDGAPDLHAERARHFGLAVERRLGEHTRLRVEGYQHDLREVLFDTREAPRLVAGRIVRARFDSRLANALRGRARGLELLLQRRSANGLSGWVSYALAQARAEERDSGIEFDAELDQRHTVNLYAAWRLTRALSVSTKYRYGSGFPLAGYFQTTPRGLALGERRNEVRQDGYSRWDVRANKAFDFDGWKLTLYGEVMNVLDQDNQRVNDTDVDLRTGAAFLDREKMFPILPAVGLTVEF